MICCRICGKGFLIAVQIWSQGRLSVSSFSCYNLSNQYHQRLQSLLFKLLHAKKCSFIVLVSAFFHGKLQKASPPRCLSSIQHMMFGRYHYPYLLKLFNDLLQHQYKDDTLLPFFFSQVEHVLSPEGSDPQRLWQNCRLDITKCDSKQFEILQGCNRINS